MDAFALILEGVRIIGWVLLHFLWQATLVGVVYAGIRALLPRGEWRYRAGMGALLVLAICPVLTARWLLDFTTVAGTAASDAVVLAAPRSDVDAAVGPHWAGVLDVVLPWGVLAWSVGVLLLSLRAWRQWRRLKILVRMAEQAPRWQRRLNAMAVRFGLRRRIAVLRSGLVATPVLVGWIRPVILLPLAVACQFPRTQVELILAHELAHLKRWDPVANLFQVALETLHFYHPVVHWISRDVRNEREICCDRRALAVTGGSRHEFAATLAELGELRGQPGSLLLAANGGVLLDRVQYLMAPGVHDARRRTPARLVVVFLATVLVALAVHLERHQVRPQETPSIVSSSLPSMMVPLALAMKGPMIPALDAAAVRFMPHLAPWRPIPATPPAPRNEAAGPAAAVASQPTRLPVMPMEALPAPTVAVPMVAASVPKMALSVSRASAPPATSAVALTPIRIRQPIYPQAALLSGEEGQVVVEFGLAPDGSLRDMKVLRSEPAGLFDQAALRALRGWKYPAVTGDLAQRRYVQTMKFVLHAALAREQARPGARAGSEEIDARAECQVLTGTHICRRPGDGAEFVRSRPL